MTRRWQQFSTAYCIYPDCCVEAGIAAGIQNGVAKNASIWDIRALDCNKSALLSDAITSLDWIVQNHVKPAITVLSLGGSANSVLDAAVESMFDEGILVIAAGGNSKEGRVIQTILFCLKDWALISIYISFYSSTCFNGGKDCQKPVAPNYSSLQLFWWF